MFIVCKSTFNHLSLSLGLYAVRKQKQGLVCRRVSSLFIKHDSASFTMYGMGQKDMQVASTCEYTSRVPPIVSIAIDARLVI